MMRTTVVLILASGALLGCSEFPELERADTAFVKNADYPALVPLDSLSIDTNHTAKVDEAARLKARAAALRARARRLRDNALQDDTQIKPDQDPSEG